MFSLVLSALRARRAQTAALFALTVLAAIGASAAPWFVGWARDSVAVADISAAPTTERLVRATGVIRYDQGAPLPSKVMRDTIDGALRIPGSTSVVAERLFATARPPGTPADSPQASLYIGYRENICPQLRIEGACPDGQGDVLIGRTTAESLKLKVGDQLRFEAFRLPAPPTLRISGIYDVKDVLSPYWAGTDMISGPVGVVATKVDESAFTSEPTLLAMGITGLDMEYQITVPPDTFRTSTLDLPAALVDAKTALRAQNIDVNSDAGNLVERIKRDRHLATLGVTVATLQLVLLCWFALYLAVRQTAQSRQPDIGLLKLRGSARWRTGTLTALQSAVPMVAGVAVGWLLGYLAAALLSRRLDLVRPVADSDPTQTLELSAAAAVAVGVVALVVCVLAEWRMLSSPVLGLLRRVPNRRMGWRAGIGDLLILIVAIAGVYQGYAEVHGGGEPSALALLAPGLVGLAAALLVARALPPIAARSGGVALRAGRAGAALAALHVARRPGMHRVFAVLAVVVCVVTTGLLVFNMATVARGDRAAQQLGAARVLTVRVQNSTKLLSAVRSADPSGRYAMAVAFTESSRPEGRVLAVDATRLANVGLLPAQYGLPPIADLPALLHPARPAAPTVNDGDLTLEASGPAAGVTAHLVTGDGADATVQFGPLVAGRRAYTAAVTGCAGGCRLVSFEPTGLDDGATLELFRLAQGSREVVPGAVFADESRWRPAINGVGVGPLIKAGGGRLSLSLGTGMMPPSQRPDLRVFVADSPTPLPVVQAGPRPEPKRAGDERISIMGSEDVAYAVVATANVLPRLGTTGTLVDLEYALNSASRGGESVATQVWLTADAPAEVLDRLKASGVEVVADTSTGQVRDGLGSQGPGVAMRFELFAAAVLLLLAAFTTIVWATVERRPRAVELAALRAQGLSDRSLRLAGYAAGAILTAAAIVTGVLAAIVGQLVVSASLPVFSDTWSLLALRSGPEPVPLLAAAGLAAVALGAAAWLGAARLVRTVRAGSTGDDT